MLTVITPAATFDLTTLATVKAQLQITDSANDEVLRDLIAQASDAAGRFCHRVFGQERVVETFRCPSTVDVLIVERTPVVTIHSVAEAGNVLDPALYECDNGAGLLYRLTPSDVRRPWWCTGRITVEYTAGWTLLSGAPYDLERAVILTVSAWWHGRTRDPLLRSETSEGVGGSSWIASADAGSLPPQAEALLVQFRHPVI